MMNAAGIILVDLYKILSILKQYISKHCLPKHIKRENLKIFEKQWQHPYQEKDLSSIMEKHEI